MNDSGSSFVAFSNASAAWSSIPSASMDHTERIIGIDEVRIKFDGARGLPKGFLKSVMEDVD